MPQAYTENQLVEQPAIGLFAELGRAVAGPPPNADVILSIRGLLARSKSYGCCSEQSKRCHDPWL